MPTSRFATFQWFTDALLREKADNLQAFFAEAFAAHVRAQHGTDPQLLSSDEASAEHLALLGIEPKPGCRWYRLYGSATAPEGTRVSEYEVTG